MWARYVEQLTSGVALAWADGDEESELVSGGWWSARTSSSRSASRPAVPSARLREIFYGR
jgi:hypothetical protein